MRHRFCIQGMAITFVMREVLGLLEMFRYRVVSGARRLFGVNWFFTVCRGGMPVW